MKAWVNAARLRTLPLSVSGILTGTAMANHLGYFNTPIFILSILATLAFQVTSNFANDYGDGIKGTDNIDRIGPKRTLQSGLLSRRELKWGITIAAVISLIIVAGLLYYAFADDELGYTLLFAFLALFCVWAALNYTIGSRAYGYRGMGDVFVFVFFGLLSVLGSMFLYTKFLTFPAVMPAAVVGLLSAAVLNLNNLRDYRSDKDVQKNTLVVYIGLRRGVNYHITLIFMAFLLLLLFVLSQYNNIMNALCLLAFIPVFLHVKRVVRIKEPLLFDPELKVLALSTFLMALLFYIGYNYFL